MWLSYITENMQDIMLHSSWHAALVAWSALITSLLTPHAAHTQSVNTYADRFHADLHMMSGEADARKP